MARCPHCGEDAGLNREIRERVRRLMGGFSVLFAALDGVPEDPEHPAVPSFASIAER